MMLHSLLSCTDQGCKYVTVSEEPYIAYCKNQDDIVYKDDRFIFNKDIEKLHSGAMEFIKIGEDSLAKVQLEGALEIEPTNPILLNDLGNLEERTKDFERAISLFKEAIKSSDSIYFPAEYNLADLYAILGEQEKAEFHYNHIIKKHRNDFLNGLAYRGLAEMYIDYGYQGKAKEMIIKAKESMENYSDFVSNFNVLEKRIDDYN
ncbi:hypothetical protein [Salegentibacter salarius]|nr:hypothetical protein [Salegentibacter salarius]